MKLLVGILFLVLGIYACSDPDPEEAVVASYEAALAKREEPADILEIATPEAIKTQREKSADAMRQDLKDMYQKSRDHYESQGRSKSSNLYFIDQVINYKSFGSSTKDNIEKRRSVVQQLIRKTAHNIHNSINFQLSSDGNTVSIKEDLAEAAKANEHLQESNVSVNSMIFALQLVAEIAQIFGQDLQNETDKNEQFEKYIEYTIIVYELIGEMIKVLNDFEHKGFSELTSMSNDHLTEIKNQRDSYNTEIKNIKSDFTAGKIDKKRYEARTTLYEGLIESLKPAEKVWQDIKSNLGDKEKVIKELKAKTELLEEKKKDAFNALSTFAQIKIAKGIKNLPQDIFKAADFILDMPLYIPDERTIELYLGVEDSDSANTNAIELE